MIMQLWNCSKTNPSQNCFRHVVLIFTCCSTDQVVQRRNKHKAIYKKYHCNSTTLTLRPFPPFISISSSGAALKAESGKLLQSWQSQLITQSFLQSAHIITSTDQLTQFIRHSEAGASNPPSWNAPPLVPRIPIPNGGSPDPASLLAAVQDYISSRRGFVSHDLSSTFVF